MRKLVFLREKIFLMVFLPLIVGIAGLLAFVYQTEVASKRAIAEHTEAGNVRMLKEVAATDLGNVVSDLLILADHQGLKSLLEGDARHLEMVEKDFITFSRRKGVYDQIRYLDETGMEVGAQYFSVEDGELRLKKKVMPAMLTVNETAIRHDCLCYLMERYPLPR